MFTHGFSRSQSISVESHFSSELLGVTRVCLCGGCACSWVFHFCLCCSSGGKCQWNRLVHLLCPRTTEREGFCLPLVVSLPGRRELVSCVLAGGTADACLCVGLSNLYIKNGQGNHLLGSERSPSCSCKLLELPLCLCCSRCSSGTASP